MMGSRGANASTSRLDVPEGQHELADAAAARRWHTALHEAGHLVAAVRHFFQIFLDSNSETCYSVCSWV